jgi:hypothetical protein
MVAKDSRCHTRSQSPGLEEDWNAKQLELKMMPQRLQCPTVKEPASRMFEHSPVTCQKLYLCNGNILPNSAKRLVTSTNIERSIHINAKCMKALTTEYHMST